MSVHKQNPDNITKISPSAGPRKAPTPTVDREHFADMRKLERNPDHINSGFKRATNGPIRSER